MIISSCSGVCLAKSRSSWAVCLWESANSEKVGLCVIESWYFFVLWAQHLITFYQQLFSGMAENTELVWVPVKC